MRSATDVLDVPGVVADLHDGLDQAAACLDAVVSSMGAVVAGTASRARTAALRRDFAAGAARVHRVRGCAGDPGALRATAVVWASGIGQPGVAALLRTLADAITAFWVEVTVACAALARALFAAAVAATSPLGVPDALGSAAAALAGFDAGTRAAERSLGAVASSVAARLGAARTQEAGLAQGS